MSCRIHVEQFQSTYYPGNTIVGKVICNFYSSTNFRSIKIKFRGREHTAWTESESHYDTTAKKTRYRTVHYTGDNKFLECNTTLAEEGSRNSGCYEFPFSFTLPLSLPSSFKGTYGDVEYYLKATVDIPWAPNYEDKKEFVVVAPIDLNSLPDLPVRPIEYEDDKTLCCCCCSNGQITMKLFLDKQAFVVGEKAKIKIYVENLSNESVVEMKVRIKMTMDYKTTNPRTRHKSDSELIAALHETGVGAHGDRTYNLELEIPQTAIIPNFTLCELFKQYSELKVEAVIPGCHSNMEIEDTIVLGHIALTGTRIPLSPPPTAPFSAEQSLPPYFCSDVPPYPTSPHSFPVPVSTKDIGFVIPGSASGSSQGYPSAPLEVSVPSAPSKIEVRPQEFEFIDKDEVNSAEPPPPSYSDALKASNVPHPK